MNNTITTTTLKDYITTTLGDIETQNPSLVTDYGLDALSAVLHETAIEKGFWDGEINYDKIGNKLALVHSEVTEVLEAIRKNKGSEEVVEELSDILIRTLDLYAAMRNTGDIIHSYANSQNFIFSKYTVKVGFYDLLFIYWNVAKLY